MSPRAQPRFLAPRALGVRARLFLVSVALVLSMGATSAVYLEFELRRELESRAAAELERHARGAAAVEAASGGPALLDRFAEATGARITRIGADGRVEGDSALGPEALAALESHHDRPEIAAARTGAVGVARRRSATLGGELMYVAVPLSGGRVLRAAAPLATIDAAIHKTHLLLLVASALGLGVSLFMTGLASHLMARPLREILDTARSLADRHGRAPLPANADELGGLATSIDRLGGRLQEVVETLAEERDRIEAVLEGMDEAVIALDDGGRVVRINRAGLKLLGLGQAPVGRPLLEAIRVPVLHDALGPALAGESHTVEVTLPGAEPKHLLARITPQKTLRGVVIVMLDVTRLRRLETVRRDFVANVSHELRTPVSVIRANAETLLAGAIHDPKRGPQFLEAMIRNSERLSALISDLLDIARIESGKFPIHPVAGPASGPAADAFEAVQPLARQRRTTVRLELTEDLWVRADAKALTQILTNLLENAVKYIPEGGQVILSGRREGERVLLEVADDGPGIALEHHDRIFERFYRVDPGRSSAMGGTGLGLSIVKHLVLAMGGQVSLHPAPARGAVFQVALAAARPPEPPSRAAEIHPTVT